MTGIEIFYAVVFVVALFVALKGADVDVSREPGNPTLPTVSQSRKIPLAVGRTLVNGPNILDAAKFNAYKNSQFETNYGQNIEMAIAYGEGKLYAIWSKDKLVWGEDFAPLEENGDSIYIDDVNFYGNVKAPGEGGLRGHMAYCKGGSSGYIFPYWEAITGRQQPGYPLLARVLFHGGSANPVDKFYWGNSESYRPIEFEYGYFPDPFHTGIYSVIGNAPNLSANPAYVLYEVLVGTKFGTSSQATIDTAAIEVMAATLHAESLGVRRTYYTESALEIEQELLDLVDAIRYRDGLTGDVIYKLLRDDYSGIPTVTDSNIVKMIVTSNSMSSVPNKVSVTYIDGATHYKEKKITESNTAARIATGHDIQRDLSFFGVGDATSAGRILTREVRKASKPRRSGSIVLDRTAWDWKRGDTFIINSELEGIVSLPVRINQHKKGDLIDRQVTIEFVEEIFIAGGALFDTPITTINDNSVAAALISEFYAIPIPRHLYRSSLPSFDANGGVKFGVIAHDPGDSDGMYIERLDGTWLRGSLKSFARPMPTTAAYAHDATSILVQGSVLGGEILGNDAIDTFENVLIVVKSATEYEYFCYDTSSLNSATGVTTFSGCTRGLYGPQPLEILAGDNIYALSDLETIDGELLTGYGSQSYRLVDVTAQGELTTANQTVSSEDRSLAPQAPGYFGINGDPSPVAQVDSFILLWRPRNYEYAATNGMSAWVASATEPLGANETITIEVWDKTAASLLLQYVDAYTTLQQESFYFVGLSTELEFRGYTTDSVTGLVSPDVSVCTFDYSAIAKSLWYASEGGTGVTYNSSALSVTGANETSNIGKQVAVNAYPVTSGKYYFEVLVNVISGTSFPAIGVVDEASSSLYSYSGPPIAVQTPAANNLGGSGNIGGVSVSSRICVAVDTATREVWIRKNSEAWAGGGDPALGTTPYKTITGTGAIWPYVDLQNACKVTANFEGAFANAVPSGFSPWGPLGVATGDLAAVEVSDSFVSVSLAEITGDLVATEASDSFVSFNTVTQDPYFYNVQLLLSMEGVDTTATFPDSSDNNLTYTAGGNAQIDTAQSQFGDSSAYFDGMGDSIGYPYVKSDFDWWTDDYTLEMWIRPSTLVGIDSNDQSSVISHGGVGGGSVYWTFGPTSTGIVRFWYYNGSVIMVDSTETIAIDVWSHIAVEHSTGFITVYVDGVGSAPVAVSGNPQSSVSSPLVLGSSNADYEGWIDDVRITKGRLRYGTDFAVPTEAHPDTLAFSPPEIAGLELWLDAADSNSRTLTTDTVDVWTDKSANGRAASRVNSPKLIEAGRQGLDVFRFTDDAFTLPHANWGTNITILHVTDKTSPTDTRGVVFDCSDAQTFSTANGVRLIRYDGDRSFGVSTGTGSYAQEVGSFGGWALMRGNYNGTTMELAVDGDLRDSATTESGDITYGSIATTNIGQWQNGADGFNGDMAEIIVYSSALPLADIEKLEGYLAHKWGLPLIAGHAYESFPPGVVFEAQTLFSAGQEGGFYDYRDLANLWQNTAGTTAADTALDDVRRVDDISGNNNTATYSGTTALKLGGSSGNWHLDTQDSDDTLTPTSVPSTSYWALVVDIGADVSGVLIQTGASTYAASYEDGAGTTPDANAGILTYNVSGNTPTTRDQLHTELTTGVQPKLLVTSGVTLGNASNFAGGYTNSPAFALAGVKLYGAVCRDTAFTEQELTEIRNYFSAT